MKVKIKTDLAASLQFLTGRLFETIANNGDKQIALLTLTQYDHNQVSTIFKLLRQYSAWKTALQLEAGEEGVAITVQLYDVDEDRVDQLFKEKLEKALHFFSIYLGNYCVLREVNSVSAVLIPANMTDKKVDPISAVLENPRLKLDKLVKGQQLQYSEIEFDGQAYYRIEWFDLPALQTFAYGLQEKRYQAIEELLGIQCLNQRIIIQEGIMSGKAVVSFHPALSLEIAASDCLYEVKVEALKHYRMLRILDYREKTKTQYECTACHDYLLRFYRNPDRDRVNCHEDHYNGNRNLENELTFLLGIEFEDWFLGKGRCLSKCIGVSDKRNQYILEKLNRYKALGFLVFNKILLGNNQLRWLIDIKEGHKRDLMKEVLIKLFKGWTYFSLLSEKGCAYRMAWPDFRGQNTFSFYYIVRPHLVVHETAVMIIGREACEQFDVEGIENHYLYWFNEELVFEKAIRYIKQRLVRLFCQFLSTADIVLKIKMLDCERFAEEFLQTHNFDSPTLQRRPYYRSEEVAKVSVKLQRVTEESLQDAVNKGVLVSESDGGYSINLSELFKVGSALNVTSYNEKRTFWQDRSEVTFDPSKRRLQVQEVPIAKCR